MMLSVHYAGIDTKEQSSATNSIGMGLWNCRQSASDSHGTPDKKQNPKNIVELVLSSLPGRSSPS